MAGRQCRLFALEIQIAVSPIAALKVQIAVSPIAARSNTLECELEKWWVDRRVC